MAISVRVSEEDMALTNVYDVIFVIFIMQLSVHIRS